MFRESREALRGKPMRMGINVLIQALWADPGGGASTDVVNHHKGNRVVYTLDAMGNRITEKTKDSAGVLVGNIARVIDALNRVQQVTGAQ